MPVVQAEARDFNMSSDHPMNLGYEPAALLSKADVIVVLESVVPWIPRAHAPRKDAKVIHISSDPLASRFPFREIEADLLIAGDPRAALELLRDMLRRDARQECGRGAAQDDRPAAPINRPSARNCSTP